MSIRISRFVGTVRQPAESKEASSEEGFLHPPSRPFTPPAEAVKALLFGGGVERSSGRFGGLERERRNGMNG